MRHRKFDFRTAYIDLLLNVLTGLVFIFAIATLLINPKMKSSSEGIKKKAEMIITASWDQRLDCDVDVWVRDPLGNVVFFQQKDSGLMHLERDDLGFRNDIITVTKNLIEGLPANDQFNEEAWVLRGLIPGQFTLNLHLYACRLDATRQLPIGAPVDVGVDVKMTKINPDYRIVYSDTVAFKQVWEEKTVLNFTLDKSGNIIDKNKNTVKLMKVKNQ